MGTSTVTTTASRVHAARAAAGVSLRQLAARSGITHRKIWQLENGLRPSPTEVQLLAAALGIPVAQLEGPEGASHV